MDRHTCTSASLHPRGRSDDRRCAGGPALHAADVVLLDNRHELRGDREGAVQLIDSLSGGLLQFCLAHLHRVLRVERLPPASDRLRDVFPGRHRAWRQRVVRRLVTGGPCQDCGHAQLRADASNSPLSATDVLYASPGVSRFPDCHRRKPPMSIRAPQTRKPISQ